MAKSITKQQVQEMLNKKVRLIDIRPKEEYEKMHIPNTLNIPAEDLVTESLSFNGEDIIVCICTHGKERGQQAADSLYKAGFKNSFYLEGGVTGWHD